MTLGFNDVSALAPRNSVTLFGVGVDDEGAHRLIRINTNPSYNQVRGSVLGSPLNFSDVRSLAYDPTGDKLYGVDVNLNKLISIHPTLGGGTAIGAGLGQNISSVESLAFDDNTGTLYGYDTAVSQLITIDTATGVCRRSLSLQRPVRL